MREEAPRFSCRFDGGVRDWSSLAKEPPSWDFRFGGSLSHPKADPTAAPGETVSPATSRSTLGTGVSDPPPSPRFRHCWVQHRHEAISHVGVSSAASGISVGVVLDRRVGVRASERASCVEPDRLGDAVADLCFRGLRLLHLDCRGEFRKGVLQ